jgi:Glycosyl hydrolase family 98
MKRSKPFTSTPWKQVQSGIPSRGWLGRICGAARCAVGRTAVLLFLALLVLLSPTSSVAVFVPPGCKPPELVISREHPLIILYGPGSGELTVKCWQHLPADIRPYCVVTMDPPALDLKERLEGWRRMLRVVQSHNIPIVLQVAGDDVAWTTPLWAIEAMLKEFPCIKAVQIVEWRCAYYSKFGGDLDMAIPANLRYLGEVLKLCGRYGKHLSLQLQTDLAHLASDQLSGPLRELFREYRAYLLPQNECIPPSFYLDQAAAWGLWLAGNCDNWGMEPQWWWWTKGESYFIRPGVFGTEAELPTDEDSYARLYRAFIIEGAVMGATVFSIEPPQDIWHGEGTDKRHFDNVIYPTLRQLIEQRLIPSQEEVLKHIKVAYQLKECRTIHEYDTMLQDLDLEVAHGYLERGAYGVLLPHLMKEMIPDTGGRYYFIPLLPVGTPAKMLQRFAKVIHPNECSTAKAYRELLNRYYPPTENTRDESVTNPACVLKCGRAIAVLQSRENLYEKQPFTVEVPRWITGLHGQREGSKLRLTWEGDPQAESYRVWKHIPGAKVYPEWELVQGGIHTNAFVLDNTQAGTFAVTAKTSAKALLSGIVNFTDYLLFTADESPIVEQLVVTGEGSRTEKIQWSDESLPAKQEVWRIFTGVQPGREKDAEAVLEDFHGLISAFEAKDLDRLMSFYDPAYRDSNGYSTEYVRRAWLWWYQRTVIPYVVAQVRSWDTSHAADGLISFTAWNRFRGTMVWDEPFGYHGRVRIPRHEGDRVTWTWKRNASGQWKLIRTEPALPNFGEMLWNSRGHDVEHKMSEFSDTPASRGVK